MTLDSAQGHHRLRRRQEVVRRLPGAEGRHHHRQGGRGRRHHRPLGIGQVDLHPVHQPPRGAPRGHDHRRRHRADERPAQHREDPVRGRHGLPAVQPLPPPHGSRQHHAGATVGAQEPPEAESEEERHGAARAGRDPRTGRQVSGTAVRWSAAACGHRPGAGDAARGSCCSTSRPRLSTPR